MFLLSFYNLSLGHLDLPRISLDLLVCGHFGEGVFVCFFHVVCLCRAVRSSCSYKLWQSLAYLLECFVSIHLALLALKTKAIEGIILMILF